MGWATLDQQMQSYREDLTSKVKIDPHDVDRLATVIATEIRFLPGIDKDELIAAMPVKLKDRLDELIAFQGFMDTVNSSTLYSKPEFLRAQVVLQNYLCFVYLSEACFLVLRKNMPTESTTRKCAKFLTDNPIRSFRNAIAHSNWSYSPDFSGLIYWARKGAEKDEPLVKSEVSQATLSFWQALSRCTAYAAFNNA